MQWLYRHVFKGIGWIVVILMLTGLYFFFKQGVVR